MQAISGKEIARNENKIALFFPDFTNRKQPYHLKQEICDNTSCFPGHALFEKTKEKIFLWSAALNEVRFWCVDFSQLKHRVC